MNLGTSSNQNARFSTALSFPLQQHEHYLHTAPLATSSASGAVTDAPAPDRQPDKRDASYRRSGTPAPDRKPDASYWRSDLVVGQSQFDEVGVQCSAAQSNGDEICICRPGRQLHQLFIPEEHRSSKEFQHSPSDEQQFQTYGHVRDSTSYRQVIFSV